MSQFGSGVIGLVDFVVDLVAVVDGGVVVGCVVHGPRYSGISLLSHQSTHARFGFIIFLNRYGADLA